jgi:hypothetical protein
MTIEVFRLIVAQKDRQQDGLGTLCAHPFPSFVRRTQ